MTPLDRKTLDAARRLVSLWEAERDAQHTGLGRTSSPLPTAPTRGEVLAAQRVLVACVLAGGGA